MKGIVDFFFSKDNRSNQNVLAGQVAIEPGRVVSPDKVSLFVKKEKKKAVVKKKPFVAKDCVTRVKVTVCPTEAIKIKNRPDKTGRLPAVDFDELHEMILEEKRPK